MRLKKFNVLFGAACVAVFVFAVVLLGKSSNSSSDEQDETRSLENKIKDLERDLKKNHEVVRTIGKSVAELLQRASGLDHKDKPQQEPTNTTWWAWNKLEMLPDASDCEFAQKPAPKADIQMLDVYRELKFDNPDGGAWKQGWNVQYEAGRYSTSRKLKVFVVPHSHNDPGWIKTFEQYYAEQTSRILDNMVRKVAEDERRRFIWAEVSYLDLWWRSHPERDRHELRRLLRSGQIEIVTGGWVMNDEANTHYFAMIEQLTSGHEWLQQKVGVAPENGWAIDPFGMSASMAYLLKRAGLEHMVVQRVHYAVKKAFAQKRHLEFRWRQNWDGDGLTDMVCHMMPFYSYDVPHTCGPDPSVCCQFDFRRLAVGYRTPIGCPWRVPATPITDANVERKARLLLDQYRKKASLYATDVLLVQLGDDFRYDTVAEFDHQFNNYQKLFDHMNGREDMFVEAKFGTLHDYFEALSAEVGDAGERLPSLAGDFFTYADIDDHYWSGYYTSRPFYKWMDRVLEANLRSAEILFSMTWSHAHRSDGAVDALEPWTTRLMTALVEARHNLALFQHHDGITGTAKDHVLDDYSNRMIKAIQDSQRVMEQCSYYLLHPQQANFQGDWNRRRFAVDDEHRRANALPTPTVLTLDAEPRNRRRRVVLYNSLASQRVQLVTVRVDQANVRVTDAAGEPVAAQLSPVFVSAHQVSSTVFDVSFVAAVPPLGLATYFVARFDGPIDRNKHLEVARVEVHSSRSLDAVEPFDLQVRESLSPFHLDNLYVRADFDADGRLVSVTDPRTQQTTPIAVEFVRYGTRSGRKGQSGAYLFLPDGPGRRLAADAGAADVHVVRGGLVSRVRLHLPHVEHTISLHHSPGSDGVGLHVDNHVDVVRGSNIEVAMRLVSGVDNDRAFYSDLNGLQMTRRERWDKLPLQAHFYPMPTMAYIEDEAVRVTVASRQPLGVASLASGQLEVMLDRRLAQDDNRGLNQGVLDNVAPTLNSFRLLVEPLAASCKESTKRRAAAAAAAAADGYPSLAAHRALHDLLYPMHRLLLLHHRQGSSDPEEDQQQMHVDFKPALDDAGGADVHVVNVRTAATLSDEADGAESAAAAAARPQQRVSLLVQRLGFDCCRRADGVNASTGGGRFSVDRLFPDYFGQHIRATTLTSLQPGPPLQKSFVLGLKPMELYAFELQP